MIELMKRVDAGGGYQGANSKPYPFIDYPRERTGRLTSRVRADQSRPP